MNQSIRNFFTERDYLEVETPVLSAFATVDINIDSFITEDAGKSYYLATSPEFHMKRLLVHYRQNMFQISKAFRKEEKGQFHNPEFTILEWYKLDCDEKELMKEIEELIHCFLPNLEFTYMSYTDVFEKFTNLNPITVTVEDLNDYCKKSGFSSTNRDELIDFVWITFVEVHLKTYDALFIYDYPASQSALAKLKPDDKRFACRFELFLYGHELANGFNELTNAKEQEIRFIIDQQKREAKNKHVYPFDKNLIEALYNQLPDCSGVAIGLDRLLMILERKSHINEVLPFTIDYS